jgi:type VI secretion system secreted protein Hcp
MKIHTSRLSNTLALAAPGAILLAGHAAGAADIFIKFEGVDGESIDTYHKGEIEVMSWSWGLSQSGMGATGGGAGAGKVSVQDFTITKFVDKASPALFLRCASGVHFATVSLRFTRPEVTTGEDYYVITLHDVTVTSIQSARPELVAGSTLSPVPTERVSLNFTKFEMDYRPLDRDPATGAPSGTLGPAVSASVEVYVPSL